MGNSSRVSAGSQRYVEKGWTYPLEQDWDPAQKPGQKNLVDLDARLKLDSPRHYTDALCFDAELNCSDPQPYYMLRVETPLHTCDFSSIHLHLW